MASLLDIKKNSRLLIYFIVVFAVICTAYSTYFYTLDDNLVLIDSLDVGELKSEAMHNYRPIGDMLNGSMEVVSYQQNETISDNIRIINGSEIFLVNSVPGKDLVMIKRYNLMSSGQSVKLFAGLQEVGNITFSGLYVNRFADFMYVIPGRYIKDTKTMITMSYLGGSNGIISAYYWFYVEGKPILYKTTLILKIALASIIIALLLAYGVRLFNSRAFVLIPSTMLFTSSLLFSYYVMGAIPHITDSYTQLFQAKLLLQGKLYLLMDGQWPCFAMYFVFYRDGHLLGKYPFGHPLVLALGEYLDKAYLVNPVLGALSVVLLYYLGREIYGENVGKYASLLMASSSFVITMAGEFMNHISMLFFVLLFSLCFFRSLKRDGLVNPLVAGLALGYGINIRPLTALAVFVPYAIYSVYTRFSGERVSSKKVAVFSAGLLFFLALFFLYNKATTGSFTISGYTYLYPDEVLGFSNGHTPEQGLKNTIYELYGLHPYLFGELSSGILLFSIILLVFSYRSINRFDVLFFGLLFSFVIAYAFYPYGSFMIFGPRYYFELTPFICMIIAKLFAEPKNNNVLKALVIVALLSSLSFVHSNLYGYFVYWGVDGRLNRLLETIERGIEGKTIIFVDDFTYISAAISRNKWNLQEDKIVYARFFTKEISMYMTAKHFPDYRCRVLYLKDNAYQLDDCKDIIPVL